MAVDFVHIHCHSQCSRFDGYASVEDLVNAAKQSGMKAVGLTDHGTFAGAIQFLKACRKSSIKPILGMETYFSRNHLLKDKKGQPDGRKGNRHLNIIAKNLTGYKNLCTLSQSACLDGYYYDPRIDFELLSKHSEGLIVTSACLSSVVNWNLLIDRYEEAKKAVGLFKDIFKDDFYLEAMYHGIDAEGRILPGIQKLALETNTKIIATNDVHYLKPEDAEYHEVLVCMSSNRSIKDPNRLKFPYNEFYFKSAEQMNQVFRSCPQYLLNTLDIAEKCDYTDIIFVEDGGAMRLPEFDLPANVSSLGLVEKLATEGLTREGLDKSPKHVQRFKQELSDLKLIWDTKKYDFATYFLIVYDIIRFSKEKHIDCGIRGSGYGSLLLKCLGVSEGVDPVEYELLWERFLGFDWAAFLCEKDFGIKY